MRGMSPTDLDPLEAAAAPITPDPRVKPKRWGQPQIDAHVRDTMGASMNNDEAQAVLMAQLMEQGIPRDEAMAIAARDMARAHIDSYGGRPTQPSQFERDYNEATGMPARPQAAVPAPQVEDDMVPLTPDQLRAMGQNPYTEPGVNMPDGTRAARPRAFENERAARIYNERVPVTDEMRGQVPQDAAFAPSMRDRAMAARGFYPVYGPDGSVGYSVGTGTEMRNSQDIADGRGIPGGLGRSGPRADLEPGFDLVPVRGPNGTVYVYRQNDESRAKQAAYMQERQIARMADATGMDETALAAMSPEERRMAVRSSTRSDAQDRMNAWKSQMMLAGRNPAKNAVNAFNSLNDPEMNDWQKAVMANALRPGMDNTTPLTVDAMGAQNALRFINSTNLGAAAMGNPAAQLAAQTWESKQDAEAADYAVQVANQMGFDTNGNAWFRSTPTDEDLKRIERRVEARFRGRGARAVSGLPTSGAAPSASTPTAAPPPPGGRAMM